MELKSLRAYSACPARPQALMAAVYAMRLGRVRGPPFFIVSINNKASFHRPSAPQQLMAEL